MFMAVFHFYSLPYLHIWISSASTTSLLLKLHQQKEVMQFKYLSIPQEKKELFVRIQILGRGRGRGRADSGKEKLKKKKLSFLFTPTAESHHIPFSWKPRGHRQVKVDRWRQKRPLETQI